MEHEIELETLLRDAGWLRRLAARLVGESGGDDLAQETWLAALRRPPRSVEEPRPWLARVARNLAANARRGSARRTAREEHAHAKRPEPTPDELAQAAEAQRLVAEAVTRLEPSLRAAVVLCYYQGLDSRTAAAQLGVPASTLRTRLQRALEELRAELDQKRGRESWMMLLVPLARGAEGAAVAAGVSGVLVLVGLLGVTVAGALVYRTRPDGASEAAGPDLTLAIASADPAETTAVQAEEPSGSREALPNTEPEPKPPLVAEPTMARLAGTFLVDGRPLEWPIELTLKTKASDPSQRVRSQSFVLPPEARGEFSFTLPLNWQGRISVEEFTFLDGTWEQSFDAPAEDLVLHLTAGPQIIGRLLEADGSPASAVEISYQRSMPTSFGTLWNGTTTLGDGRFRLWLPLVGRIDVARVQISGEATLGRAQDKLGEIALIANAGARGWLEHQAPFEPAAGLDLGDLVLEPVRERALSVRTSEGTPLVGACVRIDVARPWVFGCMSETNADGRGALFLPERACPVRVSAFGFADLVTTVTPQNELEFELTALAVLTLTLPASESAMVRLRSARALFLWDASDWDGPAQKFQEDNGASHWNTLRPGTADKGWEYEYGLHGPTILPLVGLVPEQAFELELFDDAGRSLAVQTTQVAAGARTGLTLGAATAGGGR